MNSFVFALALLLVSAAHAVQVDDYAVFTFSYKGTTPPGDAIATQVDKVVAVDLNDGVYDLETTYTHVDGTVEGPVARSFFLTKPVKSTVIVCIALEMDLEDIPTPAGPTIRTCLNASGDGKNKTWFSTNFPGTIKKSSVVEQEDGSTFEVTRELTELKITP